MESTQVLELLFEICSIFFFLAVCDFFLFFTDLRFYPDIQVTQLKTKL